MNKQKEVYDTLIEHVKIVEEQNENQPNVEQPSKKEKVREAGKLEYLRYWFTSKRSEIIIGFIYGLTMLSILDMIMNYGKTIYYLSDQYMNLSVVKVILGLLIPLTTWVISTSYAFWNFKKQKFFGLYLIIINILVFIMFFLLEISLKLFLPLIFKIPVGVSITPNMVITLARIIVGAFSFLITLATARRLFSNLSEVQMQKRIMYFKVNRNMDTRKNKEFAYDMKIVRKMEDGAMHTIIEKDRSLNAAAIGTTGTAKTSACLTVAINQDLTQKAYNEDWQKKRLYKLLKKGHISMTKDFEDFHFSAQYFEASENYKKKLSFIQTVAQNAGVTAMAPNAAFADEIYEIAKAKGINVRRLDPELVDGVHKEGFIGFNPLYISPLLKGLDRKIEVFSKATLFADVLQAIFDSAGSSDIYFASLNRNITTTITALVLLTYPSLNHGKQPTPAAVQSIINDFSKVTPYRTQLVKLYATKFNANGKEPVMDIGKSEVGEYQFILDVVDYDLIGKGADQMNNQARGLRIIINQILINPLVKDVLCAENTIDLDEMLALGQVTVVNYALQLDSSGVAFGLFFMLSFIKAVLRRPGTERTRLPHFFYVDEFPTLLHPQEEACFSLFRQYKVPIFIALQTLDQMDKHPATAYLKGVLVGNCSHQIVFGRSSTSEMELYQKLAGKKVETVEMSGVSETALSSENPNYTMSKRESQQTVDAIETAEIRYRDFKEVTVFTVNKSSPVPPFHGKVDFLSSYKRLKKRRRRYNWHKYYKVPELEHLEEEQEINNSSLKDISFQEAKTIVNSQVNDAPEENQRNEAKLESVVEANNTVMREELSDSNNDYSKTLSPGRPNVEKKKSVSNDTDDGIISFDIDE